MIDFNALLLLLIAGLAAVGGVTGLGKIVYKALSKFGVSFIKVRQSYDKTRDELVEGLQEQVTQLKGDFEKCKGNLEESLRRQDVLVLMNNETREEVHFLRNALQRMVAGEKLTIQDITPPPRRTPVRLDPWKP